MMYELHTVNMRVSRYAAAKAIKSNPFKRCNAVASDQLLQLLLVCLTHRSPITCHQMLKNLKSPGGATVLHVESLEMPYMIISTESVLLVCPCNFTA